MSLTIQQEAFLVAIACIRDLTAWVEALERKAQAHEQEILRLRSQVVMLASDVRTIRRQLYQVGRWQSACLEFAAEMPDANAPSVTQVPGEPPLSPTPPFP